MPSGFGGGGLSLGGLGGLSLTVDVTPNDDHEEQLFERSVKFNDRSQWDADQIVDNLYLGAAKATHRADQLAKRRITHIVTVGSSVGDGADSLRPENRLTLTCDDNAAEMIIRYFDKTSEFIRNAIAEGGSVLVHCQRGISRSPTIVCAYLMSRGRVGGDDGNHSSGSNCSNGGGDEEDDNDKQMTWEEAIELVHSKRSISAPNFAFLKQLYVYEKSFHSSKRAIEEFETLGEGFESSATATLNAGIDFQPSA